MPVSRSENGASVVVETVVVTGFGVVDVVHRTVEVFTVALVVVFNGFLVVVRNVGFLVEVFGRVVVIGFFVGVLVDVLVEVFGFFVGARVIFVVDVVDARVGIFVDVVGT